MRVRPSPSQPFLTALDYIGVMKSSFAPGTVFFYLHKPNRDLTDLFFSVHKAFGRILDDLQSQEDL